MRESNVPSGSVCFRSAPAAASLSWPERIMFDMSARSTDYRDAVEHLPEGAILVLPDVSWEDYEQLLDDVSDRPGIRLTYDQGRLEIMSPLPEHEEYKEFIARMVYALCAELGLRVEARGSTTWRKKRDAKGTEPDTCFYIANAERIIGKRRIDLNHWPSRTNQNSPDTSWK